MSAAVLICLWAVLSATGVMLLHLLVPRQSVALEARAPLEACVAAIARLQRQGPMGHSGEEWVIGRVGHDLHGRPCFCLGLSHRITKRSLVVCKGTLCARAGVSVIDCDCRLDRITLVSAPMLLAAFGTACVNALQRAAAASSWSLVWPAVPQMLIVLMGALLLLDKLGMARSDTYALVAAARGAVASAQSSPTDAQTGDPA